MLFNFLRKTVFDKCVKIYVPYEVDVFSRNYISNTKFLCMFTLTTKINCIILSSFRDEMDEQRARKTLLFLHSGDSPVRIYPLVYFRVSISMNAMKPTSNQCLPICIYKRIYRLVVEKNDYTKGDRKCSRFVLGQFNQIRPFQLNFKKKKYIKKHTVIRFCVYFPEADTERIKTAVYS
jgi:hypothetical protein